MMMVAENSYEQMRSESLDGLKEDIVDSKIELKKVNVYTG
jgi:hypothetical protein